MLASAHHMSKDFDVESIRTRHTGTPVCPMSGHTPIDVLPTHRGTTAGMGQTHQRQRCCAHGKDSTRAWFNGCVETSPLTAIALKAVFAIFRAGNYASFKSYAFAGIPLESAIGHDIQGLHQVSQSGTWVLSEVRTNRPVEGTRCHMALAVKFQGHGMAD